MPCVEYRLDEIGRKLRQPKHTREVGDSDAFLSGEVGYRGKVTRCRASSSSGTRAQAP